VGPLGELEIGPRTSVLCVVFRYVCGWLGKCRLPRHSAVSSPDVRRGPYDVGQFRLALCSAPNEKTAQESMLFLSFFFS